MLCHRHAKEEERRNDKGLALNFFEISQVDGKERKTVWDGGESVLIMITHVAVPGSDHLLKGETKRIKLS